MHGFRPSPRSHPGRPVAQAPAREEMLGRVLADRYRVLRRLGEGGMGTVYLCEHVVLRRQLAVKVLRTELIRDPEIVERFRQEAIAASQIGQENVVEIVDFGTTDEGALYYVMEALDGRSLGAVLRDDGPLAVDRALAVLEQICHALGAAHARGIVHRDLKPENVFVVRRDDGSEIAKLLDFGISKVEPASDGERLTRAGAIIGTPEYMAPEQATGSAVDHRADVYALGVMAYEILTGSLPLEGHTAIATLVAHQTRPPEAPSRRRAAIPLEVDAVVLRALAKRPEDRFPSMAALGAELSRIRARLARDADHGAAREAAAPVPAAATRASARGSTVTLPPEAADEVRGDRGPRMPRRGRAAAAGVLALALAVAALAAGWWLRGASDPALQPDPPTPSPAPLAVEAAVPAHAPGAPAAAMRDGDVAASFDATAAAPAPDVGPRPEPRPARPAPPRARRTPAAELKDPYGADGEPKPDPSR